jgi:formylmethanofuran dehydrogenase subunit A
MKTFLVPSAFILLAAAIPLWAFDELSDEQLKLLQDPGGWEYLKMGDADKGVDTQHICFDGTPHPDVCSGRLNLTTGKTFTQKVFIHGESAERHGTYKLDGDQLAFFDEFGTRDGPYTIQIDTEKKSLVMAMPQVRVELELEKELHKNKDKEKK